MEDSAPLSQRGTDLFIIPMNPST